MGGSACSASCPNAIAAEQLKIHYQPLTRFRDGTPNAMEALLRWQHPTLGQVPPGDFISLAEHTDLIGPLTQFVLTPGDDRCPRRRPLRHAPVHQRLGPQPAGPAVPDRAC